MEQTLINEKAKKAENDQPQEETEHSTTSKIVSFLSNGATMIKSALVKSAEILSIGIKKGGDYISAKLIRKRENPLKIGKTTKALIEGAKIATGLAVTLGKASVFFSEVLR